MVINHRNSTITSRLILFLYIFLLSFGSVEAKDASITIHLRGVYESVITLLPLSGSNALQALHVVEGVKNGDKGIIMVAENDLPGEFVLRFDYKENPTSDPYPSEKRIIINNQDMELWVHPIYCNNPDSTWFQEDERENTTYLKFIQENGRRKNILGLLQNFLLNYDDTRSAFFRQGIVEYEKRRNEYNQWIDVEIKRHKALFVSALFRFQRVPPIDWEGSETARKQSLRNNYFEGMDFSDPLILKTPNMKEWMDGYVNLYGELATSVPLRDSLFTLAGKNAIEEVRDKDPLIYGWMVDYFFDGYESFNITEGIKMLEPYLNDPNCLTAKRQEINKRLAGIEKLVPGITAPNIIMQDMDNNLFELNTYLTEKDYILLLFWSADCVHCSETTDKLFRFSQLSEINKKLDIVAISVDETDIEIQAWTKKMPMMTGWIHLLAEEGIRSKVVNDYFILGIPVMILLDAETKDIIALPETVEELEQLI